MSSGATSPASDNHSIPGLAHGVPIHSGPGPERGGLAGPHILDVGLSSTWHIAGFFGLTEAQPAAGAMARLAARVIRIGRDGTARLGEPAEARPEPPPPGRRSSGPGAVIRQALVAAGLMKG